MGHGFGLLRRGALLVVLACSAAVGSLAPAAGQARRAKGRLGWSVKPGGATKVKSGKLTFKDTMTGGEEDRA
jgi:hypothetical protein